MHRLTSRFALCFVLLLFPLHRAAAQGSPTAADPAPGIDRLSFMIGSWDVVSLDQNDKEQYRATSTIEPILGGKVLRETTAGVWNDQEWPVLILHSYDPFQNLYRSAVLDSDVGLLDVYEGTFDGAILQRSDFGPGTYSQNGETRFFFRAATEQISDDQFVIRGEYSLDDGQTWIPAGRYTYTRQ